MKKQEHVTPRAVPPQTIHAYFDEHVPALLSMHHDLARTMGGTYHIIVNGEGGGEWTVDLNGQMPAAMRGMHGKATQTMRISATDLAKILRDGTAKESLFWRGRIDVGAFLDPTPPVIVSPEVFGAKLIFAVLGTLIKIDHLNNAPKSADGAGSFIQFGEVLQLQGLKDRDLDVPINEYGIGIFEDLASLASGGWYAVDRARFLVNNLRAKLDYDSVKVTFEQDTIVADIAFDSNNPTLLGQGNAYLLWLFGIPVGWVDAAFPDVNITNFHIQLRLVPYVADNGQLALGDIGVVFHGELQTDLLVGGSANTIVSGITSSFSNNLNTKEFRDAFASAIAAIIGNVAGRPITTWSYVRIDATGISARGTG